VDRLVTWKQEVTLAYCAPLDRGTILKGPQGCHTDSGKLVIRFRSHIVVYLRILFKGSHDVAKCQGKPQQVKWGNGSEVVTLFTPTVILLLYLMCI
jgi:hypothetical protein